jgi:hypothetical protein
MISQEEKEDIVCARRGWRSLTPVGPRLFAKLCHPFMRAKYCSTFSFTQEVLVTGEHTRLLVGSFLHVLQLLQSFFASSSNSWLSI